LVVNPVEDRPTRRERITADKEKAFSVIRVC